MLFRSNLTLAPSNPLNFRQDFVRLDYHLNDRHFLYGRWINDNNSLIDPYGTFSDSGVLPTTPTQRNRPGQSFLLAHTWNISPTIINQAQANFSYAAQRIPPYGVNWERSTFGFQFNRLYPGGGSYPAGIPKVSVTGFAPFQGPNFALKSPTTDIEVGDSISFIKGNHLIKAGVIVIRDRVDQNGRPYYTGNINFNGSNASLTTGNAIADALIGNFASYSEASSDPTGHFRFTQPEAFVQDSWRMLRNLSIEYGIRFQYIQSMYTQANNMGNFDPSVYAAGTPVSLTFTSNPTIVPNSGNPFNGLVRAGSGVPADQASRVPNINTSLFPLIPAGAPRGLYNMNGAVGPRFGFAYAAGDKTSIRGGYGMFYFRPEGNLTFSQVNVAPFLSNTEFDNGNLATLGTGTPNTSAIQGTITAINPHLINPYVQQYSLGVQRQLPYDILLETSYVGNVGRHLVRQPNINFPSLTGTAANTGIGTNYFNPYKGYSTISMWLSDSTTNYNSLQIYASKRAGRVSFTAGYTYAKNLGDSSSNNATLENWQNIPYNYGSLSIDRKHAFVGTAVWQIAELRGQNMMVREVLGGWQLSGVGRAQSGPYYTITSSTATGTRRSDFLGGPYLVQSGRNANNYINKAAFGTPPATRFGNSGVAPVEGPGLQQIDATLAKTFAAERRVQARFQWDMFNVLNRTNYSNLNATTTASSFGTISAAYPPRQMQFGLRIIF